MLLASIATVNWGAAPAANAGQASAPQAGAPAQPDLTAVKTDFVPGEKTIFYDDFSDMAAGDAPATSRFAVRRPNCAWEAASTN